MEVHFDSGGAGGSTSLNLDTPGFEEQIRDIGKLNGPVAKNIYSFLHSKNTLDTRMETIIEFAFDQDEIDESYYCKIAKLCLTANEIHAQLTKSHKDRRYALSEQQINKLKSNIDKIEKLKQVEQESAADWIEGSDSPGTRQAPFPHELGKENIAALKKSRMDPKHDRLNEELE